MCMLKERVQVLMTKEQRRRLETEAASRGTSVGSLIREAVDARFGTVSRADRLAALRHIEAMEGVFLTPEEINEIVAQERDAQFPLADLPSG